MDANPQIIALARCIDGLLIDEQSIDDAAHLDQLLPVPAVAGEARNLARCHGPNLAEADVGHHPLKAGARHCAGRGAPKIVIDDLDVAIPPGVITTIIGPNGCGKSTLLRTLTRLLKPAKGTVVLDGEDIVKLKTRDVARKLGLLPQSPVAPEGLTVSDLVARGRHPHQSWLRQWSSDDAAVVERAPTNDYALFCLGRALMESGRPADARKPLTLAAGLRPDRRDYRIYRDRARAAAA